jgi:histone H3/H4
VDKMTTKIINFDSLKRLMKGLTDIPISRNAVDATLSHLHGVIVEETEKIMREASELAREAQPQVLNDTHVKLAIQLLIKK